MRACSVDDCGARHYARGFCRVHYNRWERHGDPTVNLRPRGVVCSVDGCEIVRQARGLCWLHYQRWDRTGSTEIYTATDIERFWAKIRRSSTGCWEWVGAISDTGYGGFGVGGKTVNAHRYSYEVLVGPIPVGLEIDHLCRVRCCVNPSHLEPVTHLENVRRAVAAREVA